MGSVTISAELFRNLQALSRKSRKARPPPKDFVVVNVRPFVSVRLSAFVGAAFTGRIFVKYYIGDLKNAKIRRETADLVKIVQKYRALFVRTQVLLHR